MTCRYCLENKPLVKSHIIPESFFPKNEIDEKPSRMLTNRVNIYPKKMPIGVYDQTILCLDCEKQFDRCDNYAQKVLLENFSLFSDIHQSGKNYGHEFLDFDYILLKYFFTSLVWRASVSTHEFYRRINLGPWEAIALGRLKSDEPIPVEIFSVILSRFDHKIGKSMLDPYYTKLEGINFICIYMGGYAIYIKVDKRPCPNLFSQLVISPNQPLRVLSRSFLESKEYPLLQALVFAPHNRK